jgi:hypothetical protein
MKAKHMEFFLPEINLIDAILVLPIYIPSLIGVLMSSRTLTLTMMDLFEIQTDPSLPLHPKHLSIWIVLCNLGR